jgi:hypothetical protein
MTRPLRVGVVGADPNRSWANGTLTHTWPNVKSLVRQADMVDYRRD